MLDLKIYWPKHSQPSPHPFPFFIRPFFTRALFADPATPNPSLLFKIQQ